MRVPRRGPDRLSTTAALAATRGCSQEEPSPPAASYLFISSDPKPSLAHRSTFPHSGQTAVPTVDQKDRLWIQSRSQGWNWALALPSCVTLGKCLASLC